MKIQTHSPTHERNAMKPQPKWQAGSILVLGGISASYPRLVDFANELMDALKDRAQTIQ